MRKVFLFLPLILISQVFGQNDAKVAAVQRACATGVLSRTECQAQLAKLRQSGAATAEVARADTPAGNHWSDPRGRFTIAIAPGWQIDSSQPNLKVTKDASWAIFDTESHPSAPMDVAQSNAKSMATMLPSWKVVQQQSFETPRHHAAAGVTAFADVPMRNGNELRVMTFAAQSAGNGNYVTLTASSLKNSAQVDQSEVMAMFNSIRFAGER